MEQDKEKLEIKVQDCEEQMEYLEEQLSKSRNECKSLEQSFNEQKQRFASREADLKQRNEELKTELNKSEDECLILEGKLSENQAELAELEEFLEEVRKETELFKTEVDKERQELLEKIVILESSLESLQSEKDGELEKWEKERNERENILAERDKMIANLDEELKEQKKKHEENEKHLVNFEELVGSLNNRIEDLERIHEKSEMSLEEMESDLISAKEENEKLELDVTEKKDMIANLEESLQAVRLKVNDLDSEKEELESRINEMQTKNREVEEKCGKMDDVVASLRNELKNLKLENSDLETEKEELKSALETEMQFSSQQSSKLKDSDNRNESKGNLIVELRKEILSKREKIGDLEGLIKEMEKELRGKVEELDSLATRLELNEANFKKEAEDLKKIAESARKDEAEAKEKLSQLQKEVDKMLPEKQTVEKETTPANQDEIEKIKENYESLKLLNESLEKEKSELTSKVSEQDEFIETLVNEVEVYKKEKEEKISELEKKIKELQEKSSDGEEEYSDDENVDLSHMAGLMTGNEEKVTSGKFGMEPIEEEENDPEFIKQERFDLEKDLIVSLRRMEFLENELKAYESDEKYTNLMEQLKERENDEQKFMEKLSFEIAEYSKIKDEEMKELSREMEDLRERNDVIMEFSKDKEEEVKDLTVKIEDLQKRIEELMEISRTKEAEIKDLNSQIQNLDAKNKELGTVKKDNGRNWKEIKEIIPAIQEKFIDDVRMTLVGKFPSTEYFNELFKMVSNVHQKVGVHQGGLPNARLSRENSLVINSYNDGKLLKSDRSLRNSFSIQQQVNSALDESESILNRQNYLTKSASDNYNDHKKFITTIDNSGITTKHGAMSSQQPMIMYEDDPLPVCQQNSFGIPPSLIYTEPKKPSVFANLGPRTARRNNSSTQHSFSDEYPPLPRSESEVFLQERNHLIAQIEKHQKTISDQKIKLDTYDGKIRSMEKKIAENEAMENLVREMKTDYEKMESANYILKESRKSLAEDVQRMKSQSELLIRKNERMKHEYEVLMTKVEKENSRLKDELQRAKSEICDADSVIQDLESQLDLKNEECNRAKMEAQEMRERMKIMQKRNSGPAKASNNDRTQLKSKLKSMLSDMKVRNPPPMRNNTMGSTESIYTSKIRQDHQLHSPVPKETPEKSFGSNFSINDKEDDILLQRILDKTLKSRQKLGYEF